eukprot:m.30022 g.30022  ORF g.30022 m.30022 type:complete len:71 (-) comp16200_c0_seq2:44-256(-)
MEVFLAFFSSAIHADIAVSCWLQRDLKVLMFALRNFYPYPGKRWNAETDLSFRNVVDSVACEFCCDVVEV